MKGSDIITFFNSQDFEVMMYEVARDDKESFKNQNDWLNNHPKESMIFKGQFKELWSNLTVTYNSDFRAMVFGELPDDDKIIGSMELIQERMNKLDWNFTRDN